MNGVTPLFAKIAVEYHTALLKGRLSLSWEESSTRSLTLPYEGYSSEVFKVIARRFGS